MATNVHLTPELESFARTCVEGGLHNNVSEVVRSGLRLLKERDDRRRAFDALIARTLEERGTSRPCCIREAARKASSSPRVRSTTRKTS